MPERATSRPMSCMASAKSSRSSPVSMESMSQPMTSTPYFSSTSASARPTAQLRPVWPPILGSRASGRSLAMTFATDSTVIGSM